MPIAQPEGWLGWQTPSDSSRPSLQQKALSQNEAALLVPSLTLGASQVRVAPAKCLIGEERLWAFI